MGHFAPTVSRALFAMFAGRAPMVLGLSGLTVGLGTIGFVLEKNKRAKLAPMSQLDQVIQSHPYVMFGTTSCSFCRVAQSVFDREELSVHVITLDKPQRYPNIDMNSLVGQLFQSTKCHTVPQIFINGEFIGGSTELRELRDSGALRKA